MLLPQPSIAYQNQMDLLDGSINNRTNCRRHHTPLSQYIKKQAGTGIETFIVPRRCYVPVPKDLQAVNGSCGEGLTRSLSSPWWGRTEKGFRGLRPQRPVDRKRRVFLLSVYLQVVNSHRGRDLSAAHAPIRNHPGPCKQCYLNSVVHQEIK